jgi:hypothetical protein
MQVAQEQHRVLTVGKRDHIEKIRHRGRLFVRCVLGNSDVVACGLKH